MSLMGITLLYIGLGWSAVIISAGVIVYDMIMTWVLYYLFKSFAKILPWSTCGNAWNTEQCQELQLESQVIFKTALFIFHCGHQT